MRSPRRLQRALLLAASALLARGLAPAPAAGQGGAPRIAQDSQADITAVYAFVGTRYDDPGSQVLNVLVQVRPFSEPGNGLVFERFADDALYSIHIVEPATAAPVLRYDFRFSDVAPLAPPGLKDPDALLSYGSSATGSIEHVADAQQNYTQTYEVQRRGAAKKERKPVTLAAGLATAPANVGRRATPHYNDPATGKAISGATSFAELDVYTQESLHDLPDGEAVFAGPRDDGFYCDLAGLSDLVDPRLFQPDATGQAGGGPDTFAGANALVYAIQIPLASLPSSPYTALFSKAASGVGVYASVSRGTRKLKKDGTQVSKNPAVQVSRMGNPLFNQLLVPLGGKDAYHRTSPEDDAALAVYALEPALARLLNETSGFGFVTTGRTDLVTVFVPDVLRVDTTTGPVRLAGQAGFSRLGGFGGDSTGTAFGGWPNGRRPGDDVMDILLTLISNGPAQASVLVVGDNVAANDEVYHQVFPYLATPHSGANP